MGDFQNLEWCKSFARRAPDQLVVKHDNRDNYNITHKSRTDLWDKPGVTVVYDPSKG